MSDDVRSIDQQWSERYRNDVNRLQQRITALEQETQGLRQLLIVLKMHLRSDGRDKWHGALTRISQALDESVS